MSLNPNVRTECVETLLNRSELSTLDAARGGMARSVYMRFLLSKEVQAKSSPPSAPKESRHCPGVGKPASRAGFAGKGQRRLI